MCKYITLWTLSTTDLSYEGDVAKSQLPLSGSTMASLNAEANLKKQF